MFKPCKPPGPTNSVLKSLKAFFEKHGESVYSHDFRMTQATMLWKHTKDPIKVQQFLGHTRLETTMKYIKAADETLQNEQMDYLTSQSLPIRERP